METQIQALGDVESMPDVDWFPNTEIVHLFGTEERMFLELDSELLEDDVLYASDGREVEVLEYDNRAYVRDGGTTIWDIADGYDAEVLVNPSDSKVERGEQPQVYFEDPTQGYDVGAWWYARSELLDQEDVSFQEMTSYISNGRKVL